MVIQEGNEPAISNLTSGFLSGADYPVSGNRSFPGEEAAGDRLPTPLAAVPAIQCHKAKVMTHPVAGAL